MQNPHPGLLLQGYLERFGISHSALAISVLRPQSHISRIAKARAAITVDAALRLAAYFETMPPSSFEDGHHPASAKWWLDQQQAYDLDRARQQPDYLHLLRYLRPFDSRKAQQTASEQESPP